MEDCKKCREPLERIQERLNTMLLKLELKQHSSPEQVFFDNQEFIQLMNISKRTAQAWRVRQFFRDSTSRLRIKLC